MPSGSSSPAPDPLTAYTLTFDQDHLRGHTFLLGNRGGFVLYLPAAVNRRDRTMHPIKWFGASGFGRSFFEALPACVEVDGRLVELCSDNQIQFIMGLDGATRVYSIGNQETRESFFVPDGCQAFVVSLDGDVSFVLKPEFDMRYYQEFNTDFSCYRAEETPDGLLVSNRVENVGPLHATMEFYGLVGALSDSMEIDLLPEDERLVDKTYLKDELREKLIVDVYEETHARAPDEAPIWDLYGTRVYAPARLRLHGPTSIVCAFGDTRQEAVDSFRQIRDHLPDYRRAKQAEIVRQLDDGLLETGNREVDLAYAHVLTRFDDALVARDAELHVDPVHRRHYYAIFAGDKYFMDAWKRDENISLGALLATNDFDTVRHILQATWQFQDPRTGRLPHIIRAGEPLVYYSSDGTLWALQRLFEYTRQSGDRTLLDEKLPMVETFFRASMNFVQRGLLPSGGIVDKEYLWETWEDTPFTPRAGYPVEIELLWLTVLSELLPFIRARDVELADTMAKALTEGRETFNLFIHDGYLVDSLTYGWEETGILTPNGYIAFGLDYPLPADLQRSMVELARAQLAGRRGVRSLAPRDWAKVLPADFLADPHSHRGDDMASVGIFNYHRGIEWEWLNPFFVEAELRCGSADQAFTRYVEGQVREAIHETGIGGLSELHDMRGQVGADFQAWSMAGFLESLHLFAGVEVDAAAGRVRVLPSIPAAWPYLRCRRRVGDTRFEVLYRQPSPTSRHLKLRLLDPPPDGFQLQLGFRLSPGSSIGSARCNGEVLPAGAWEQREGCAPDVPGAAWITRPLDRDLTLQVEIMGAG